MKQLTQKEEEIMERMWDHGPMLVRELQSYYDEPRPHVNTLATLMRKASWATRRSPPAASSILLSSAARSIAAAR